jgi:hypothetical protein
MDSFSDGVEELQKILALGRQQWLLGAGVSFAAIGVLISSWPKGAAEAAK